MSKPFIVAYARCSTERQDLDIQIAALEAAGADRIFQEKVSGAKEGRVELRKALDSLQPGNIFMVYRIDRLARSVLQAETILRELKERGAEFKSVTEGFDTTTPGGKAFFQMASVFAEMERATIAVRVQEGVRAAQAKGVRFGRKRADHPDNAAKLERARALIKGGLSVTEAAGAVGLARSTVYKYGLPEKTDTPNLRTGKKTPTPSETATEGTSVVKLAAFRK